MVALVCDLDCYFNFHAHLCKTIFLAGTSRRLHLFCKSNGHYVIFFIE